MESTTFACHCGSVQIHISGATFAQFYCHCDDCRAVTGGAFTPIALFPAAAVTITGGRTFSWTYKTLPRARCSSCGIFLFGEPPGAATRGVSGFLLPAAALKPTFHIHCQHAVLPIVDDLPHFKDLPTSFGGSDERVGW